MIEKTPQKDPRGPPPPSLPITVNGTPTSCPAGFSVDQLIGFLALPKERVAVERNREIVRRDTRSAVWVEAGDVFEIVTFVGGG